MVTFADLSRILDATRYPPNRHRSLTDLMQESELCFPLPDRPTPTFLIPGILPKEEPEDVRLSGDTLEFQYHYRILPNTVLSRFIVQMHEKIHKQTCWRTGVLLAYREGSELYNTALIRSDPADQKIFITITGRDHTRRSFLSLIRDTFTRIHNSFGNLEHTEWVPVPNHPDHPPLDYEDLRGLEAMGETHKVIGTLQLKIDLRKLLDGYESLEARQKSRNADDKYGRESNAMSNEPRSIINNFQVENIANFANHLSDNSQQIASQFSQTSGASTTELLDLIRKIRQAAQQFPAEVQADLIIDIDDVEEEIKKPENQRNQTKLRKRLIALMTAVGLVAAPVAAITDFANNLTDLGTKMDIEIPQFPKSQQDPGYFNEV